MDSPARCSSPAGRSSGDGSSIDTAANSACPGLAAAVMTAARQSSVSLQLIANADGAVGAMQGAWSRLHSSASISVAQPNPTNAEGDAASVWSGISQRNPVPSATTMSVAEDLHPYHSDYKARASRSLASGPQHEARVDAASETSHARSAAALTARNPIVTPTASEAASIAGDNDRGLKVLEPSQMWGLPTVDEVPKAPPEYLVAAGADVSVHNVSSGSYWDNSARTASQTAAQLMYLPDDTGNDPLAQPYAPHENVDASHTHGTSGRPSAGAQQIGAREPQGSAAPQSGVEQPADSSTTAAPPAGGEQQAQPNPAAAPGDLAASLAMYEERLEAAKGRSAELTDYLTALQARKDEVCVVPLRRLAVTRVANVVLRCRIGALHSRQCGSTLR